MALRKFEEESPSNEGGIPGIPDFEESGLPPEIAQELFKPLVKAALDSAIHEMIAAGEAAIKEERKLGQPGPKWDALLTLVQSRLRIDPDDKLRIILVTRLVFLLIAARNLLPPDTDIDPNTTVFRD